jgi:hypothetical protein
VVAGELDLVLVLVDAGGLVVVVMMDLEAVVSGGK